MKLGRGAVVVVELDPALGHQQHGVRPCVVVSDSDVIGDRRWADPLVRGRPGAPSGSTPRCGRSFRRPRPVVLGRRFGHGDFDNFDNFVLYFRAPRHYSYWQVKHVSVQFQIPKEI